jgi:hypothetical protein
LGSDILAIRSGMRDEHDFRDEDFGEGIGDNQMTEIQLYLFSRCSL